MEKQAYDRGDCSQSVESPVKSSAIVAIIWKIKFSFCQQSPTITATANDQNDCNRWDRIKPGLPIVITISEHGSDDVPKRVLKLSTYRLQIFLV